MKKLLFLSAVLAIAALRPVGAAEDSVRIVQSFESEWLFSRGDIPASEDPMFDDVNWRTVDLPHDWAIEGPAIKDEPVGRGGGYRPSGVSWYRKRFSLPSEAKGRRVFVEFDGVMANAEVWINGRRLGQRPSGYVSFTSELTGQLKLGEEETNVLAVRTDTTLQPASRWYTGQGIYRHVRLVLTDPVRVTTGGLYVTTPEITAAQAVARVRAAVVNGADHAQTLTVQVIVSALDGREVATTTTPARSVGIGETAEFSADLKIASPQLWAIGEGNLYRATVRVSAGDKILDEDSTAFGIRDARFEAATGFWLNGHNVKLKGVALHHDGGAVGAAVPLGVWERRLERLRTLGVNAIRTAHNPPAPDFLDLCDRMGFLVMDEFFDAWTAGKPHAEHGYNVIFPEWGLADERDTLRRDRNHPSIILWSTGNEIHDTPNAALAKNILAQLVGLAHMEDPSRPVTQALFRPNTSHDFTNGLADMLDVIGVNYRDAELLAAHQAKPTRRILGSEQGHERNTWLAARDNPQHAGQFLWAGIDYLGEADWPYLTSSSGLLDRTGRLKPRAYERQSWWSDAPMVHIARQEPVLADTDARRRPGFDLSSNWTPAEPTSYPEAALEVYSNCDEVELFLNGQSLGEQPKPADASPRTWKVTYAPGILRAVGRNGGKEVASHELRTAGPATKLVLSVDHSQLTADWNDVATVTVMAVDANGVPCPWATPLVTFKLDGPGVIAGVDNGDRADPAPYLASERKLFQGEAVALIKAADVSGTIKLSASASGLSSGEITLTAAP
jgi:beta-galactosidase